MAVLIFVPNAQPSRGLDDQPVVAQLQFYEPDTAQATPATVYTDAALTTPHPWPLPSDSSGNFPAIWAADDAVYSVTWSTNDGQSASWDDIDGVATSYGALIAAAQAAQAGAVTAQGEAEGAQTAAEAAQAAAEAAEAAAAVILTAVEAAGGNDGWSPIIAVATDGARRVFQITDWTGGGGTKPGIGYIGAGGIVALITDGVDIRGPAGSATGDVTQDGAVTAGHIAAWSGTGLIEDGGVLGGMAALDLASQAEAEAGVSNSKGMSPLRVAQAIAALSGQYSASLPLLSKAANYQILAADRGGIVSCTGSFTLSFDACATLGSNWFCYIYNAGTGDVALDPNGAETIDGLSTYTMYPGELRIVRCSGTALTTYILKGFSKAFTASGTFTKPPGYNDFEGEAWGGGGSGSGGGGDGGGGGGGGACVQFKLPASALLAAETVTIGAGGASVSSSVTYGNNGGNTTLGALITAYGGARSPDQYGGGGGGVLGAASDSSGGSPRIPASDNPGFGGADGATTAVSGYSAVNGGGGGGFRSGSTPTAGGRSISGGGGGGACSRAGASFSLGGASILGGSGGNGAYNTSAVNGSAPGGGGGGVGSPNNAHTSGAGARGEVRIRGIT